MFLRETFIFIVVSLTILAISIKSISNFAIVIARICQLAETWQSKSIKDYWLLMFGISWFIAALSPVIFFTSHNYPHYAIIAAVGLYLIIAGFLSQSSRKLRTVFIVLWIIQFIAAQKINLATHWWPRHALEASSLISEIKNNYPFLPGDKRLFLTVCNPVQAKLVLSGDNAVKLIYNDPDAKLYFNCNPQL